VTQQVSPDVTVWCDPGMCQQLRLDGFPAGRLKPLGSGVRALLGSGIVVATPAVRGQLGSTLAAGYAPQVIASFGAGAATGFGGTAPHGPGSPLPWLEVIAGGLALAAGGGLALRCGRRGAKPRHALSRQALSSRLWGCDAGGRRSRAPGWRWQWPGRAGCC
jgi:hypothetical protein